CRKRKAARRNTLDLMLDKLTSVMNINLINKMMIKINKNYFLPVLAFCFLSSCGDLSKEAEKKLNELKDKTESLDSLINKEVDKVLTLDSLINLESDKVKKLDSLINKTSSKLDSIANEKVKLFEKIIK
ncbi:MAG: hypothetical protein JXA03_05710, partial [Bacteroidales bacterium]|nr:hypothetical protein [Bacteroidales bacterium]